MAGADIQLWPGHKGDAETMEELPKHLPSQLKDKTAGVFLTEANMFLDDVTALGGRLIPLDFGGDLTAADEADYFLLDTRSEIGHGYAAILWKILDAFKKISSGRTMYAAIPYKEMNYQWDVYNETIPSIHGDAFPGARHVYDNMLADFAVRAIGNVPMDDKMRCMLLRLTPLDRTVICVMSASGQGKTTFVRQLKQNTGSYHVSSDYLLSSILGMKASDTHSDQIKTIKTAVATVPSDKIWSRFFRMVEEDDALRIAFLDIVALQLEAAGDKRLVSFDIDAREQETRSKIKDFFQERGLKVWICTT